GRTAISTIRSRSAAVRAIRSSVLDPAGNDPLCCGSGGCSHVCMSELTMKKAQREAFLAGLHVGVVAVARDGEAPLAAPVWYSYEPGGDVVFVFESASEKIKLFEAEGQATLCVQ